MIIIGMVWSFLLNQETGKNLKKIINQLLLISCLYVNGTKDTKLAYKSEYNSKREEKVILLMIGDFEKWHYLAVKNLPRLLRGISSNHIGDNYRLGCFHSYSTVNKLKKHERVCNNHKFREIEMPTEKDKILKYSHGQKSLRVSVAYYCDIESLIKKIDTCYIILKNHTHQE